MHFLSKIRVYDLAGQDDAGAWMAHTYPQLFIIRNVLAYKGMSFRFRSKAWDHTRGGDETVVTRDWVRENIQENHGPQGKLYRNALHLWEGDTLTYFYLMPTGLNDPEKQWQGSWGGRFTREKQKNVDVAVQEYAGADCSKGCFVNEGLFLGYANLPLAIGALIGGPAGAFIFHEIMCKNAIKLESGLLELNPFWNSMGWVILMGIGFVSAFSMWLYNRWLQKNPI